MFMGKKARRDLKGTNDSGGQGERVRGCRVRAPRDPDKPQSALPARATRPLPINLWTLGKAEGHADGASQAISRVPLALPHGGRGRDSELNPFSQATASHQFPAC
jgi:hypothetical protein